MKKTIILLAIISIFISFGCAQKETVDRNGIVNSIVGSVTITTDDKSVPAKVGDSLVSGMIIETGARSLVHISFGENVVKLSENTILYIETLDLDLISDSEQTGLSLRNGEVFSRVAKNLTKGDSFQIRTPTTVAAIRGTEFGVIERDGETKVACVSGRVEVTNTTLRRGSGQRVVEISANEEVVVVSRQPLSVRTTSEENRERMRSVFEDIRRAGSDPEENLETEPEIVQEVVKKKQEKKPVVRRTAKKAPAKKPEPVKKEVVVEDPKPDIKKISIDAAKPKDIEE